MSSLISTIPPMDLLIKHEANNGSPHSMSNISSPNTTIGGGNFSPAAQQQHQQQQQQQAFTPGTTNNNGIGASAGSNNNNFLSFFNNGGNISPTEGSTASDQSGGNGLNNSITSNTAVTNSGISSVLPATNTINANSTGSGVSVNSAMAEDDFAAGIGTSTTYNNNLGFSASSASSNASTINSGSSSICGVTNGCNIMAGIIPNNNSSNMMGINNNNNFNSTESSLKQQQFSLMPQHFSQQQLKFHQQQQQRNFNVSNEISSDSGNSSAAFSMQLGMNSSQTFSENSAACYGMPQSAPSFSQTIRNPFEEEEQLSSLKNQRSMSAKPGNMCATSSSGSPLSSPSYFEHYRNQRRQMMPDLPQFNPGSYPPGSREHQLALERYRLPYTFHANQRRQLVCPYPLPGIGPNGQPMSMMLRLPPSYIQMNPALINSSGGVNGKLPFFGPPGSHMVMTPAGPVLVGPNGQVIGAPRPSSIGTPQQQPNGCSTPGSNNNAPIALPKKESKKRETKLTKKQQQVLQQQQAEADAIRQQQHLHQQQQQQQQVACSMINNIMMPGNSVGVPPQIPMIDNGNNGSFSPSGCRLTPNELKQRLHHQNAMQHIGGALSPNHFKILGRSTPFQRSAKLHPMHEQRIPETGDCTQQRRGIRCTAMSQGCGLCYHTDCAQLSQVAYTEFHKDYRIEWVCQSCTQRKTICFDI